MFLGDEGCRLCRSQCENRRSRLGRGVIWLRRIRRTSFEYSWAPRAGGIPWWFTTECRSRHHWPRRSTRSPTQRARWWRLADRSCRCPQQPWKHETWGCQPRPGKGSSSAASCDCQLTPTGKSVVADLTSTLTPLSPWHSSILTCRFADFRPRYSIFLMN